MTVIFRQQFIDAFNTGSLDVGAASRDARLRGLNLRSSDLDNDGRIHGAAEAADLFERIERSDGDRDRSTLRLEQADGRATPAGARFDALAGQVASLRALASAGRAADPSAASRDRIATRLAGGAERVLGGTGPDAAELRRRYGIPPPDGSGRDGWHASSEGRARRVGLLRRDEGALRTSLESAASRLAGDAGEARRRSVARQLDALRREDPSADPALVLAVATRESGMGALSSSRARADTFHQGGLDHLGRDVASGRIRPPRGFGPWPPAEQAVNELGRPAQGAMVPRDELLTAYGLELRRSRETFERHVREVFGDRAGEMLRTLSPEARRAWTQVTFAAPGGAHFREGSSYGRAFGCVTALEMLRSDMERGRATGLGDVLRSESLGRYTIVRRARVTAAEAEGFDSLL